MSASRRLPRVLRRRAAIAAVALFALCLAVPAWSDDVPTAQAVVEQARALARRGSHSDAEEYLAELVLEGSGPYADNAEVLLEAARLSSSAEVCRGYALRAIEHTRSGALLGPAHMLLGDAYFAESLYLSAAREYEQAARHSTERGPGTADLKRARSILASGDAGEAVKAYREIADWGATPGAMTAVAEVGLARALLTAGRPEEAAEQFERTARLYDDSEVRARALAGAAESHEAAGADSLAVLALQRLVSDLPDSYEAVLARERLRAYAPDDGANLSGDTADTTALPSGLSDSPER